MSSNDIWAECSDEENYFESKVQYRTDKNGKKIFEPSGEELFSMYDTISKQGFIDLDWQCPGRISPSELNQIKNDKEKSNNEKQSEQSESTKTEFDFDIDNDDDNDDTFMNKSNVLKKSQVGKKSETNQTNLNKIMQDIKKYQNA